ncbi:GIY-YIG nuclease family protein [Xanthomonas sp. AM6]|uniref:GIY-YIG nuclease family protein n=1 Tax=Xanthomonas sp. AM6 TaxID=2982531 RepID=UPI0021D8028D|nr:GIY-YIG nuclease family protein [Xanthomonas sp. AM6]UYB51937.1 GIY-YIG nuclease family protein [Xanthomonas sp. AM6]
MADSTPWFLYLLECRNGSYYAGITVDLEARFQAHLRGTGAKYTRANPPLRLLASRAYPDRAAASRAEWALKQLPRARKLAFLHALDDSAAPVAAPADA